MAVFYLTFRIPNLRPTRRLGLFYKAVVVSLASISGSIMILQAAFQGLPFIVYLVSDAVFVISLLVTISWSRKAFLGIFFLFSGVKILMYFISTRFLVLPFGDAYGQLGISEVISKSGHLSVLNTYIPLPALQVAGYSNWPGLEITTVFFNEVTGVQLFQSALLLSLALYMILLLASLVLIRHSTRTLFGPIGGLDQLILILTMSFYFVDLPPVYKYEEPATVIFLLLTFLLIKEKRFGRPEIVGTFALLVGGLAIMHNLTAAAWILILTLLLSLHVLVTFLLRIPRFIKPWSLELKASRRGVSLVLILSVLLIFAWWTFYGASYGLSLITYEGNSIPSIFSSLFAITPNFILSSKAYLNVSGVLSSLTPSWILGLLRARNYLMIGLLATGYLAIFVRPKAPGSQKLVLLLLITGPLVAFSFLQSSASIEGRFAPLLAPFLGIIMCSPFVFLSRRLRSKSFPLAGVYLVVGLFAFTSFVGFWGNSYAPMFLISPGATQSSFGEHPLDYGAVSQFLTFMPTSQTCLFTNELYVTSLVLPVVKWGQIGLIGESSPSNGCLSIVYRSPSAFNDSYIAEYAVPYSGFSYTNFRLFLYSQNDQVMSATGNVTLYYNLGR